MGWGWGWGEVGGREGAEKWDKEGGKSVKCWLMSCYLYGQPGAIPPESPWEPVKNTPQKCLSMGEELPFLTGWAKGPRAIVQALGWLRSETGQVILTPHHSLLLLCWSLSGGHWHKTYGQAGEFPLHREAPSLGDLEQASCLLTAALSGISLVGWDSTMLCEVAPAFSATETTFSWWQTCFTLDLQIHMGTNYIEGDSYGPRGYTEEGASLNIWEFPLIHLSP